MTSGRKPGKGKNAVKAAPKDPIEMLTTHSNYHQILAALSGLTDWSGHDESMLKHVLLTALAGPLPHEKFTKSERIKTADKISSLAKDLSALLYLVHGEKEIYRDWPYEFQALNDRMALQCALDYQDSAGPKEESEVAQILATEDGFHVARYSVYHSLMDCLPEMLNNLADAAEMWKEHGDQPLAKPNHKNADRLYFMRKLTGYFVGTYGKPLRKPTLDITSIYFDCSDLDEAALSNLAPVTQRMRNLYKARNFLKEGKVS